MNSPQIDMARVALNDIKQTTIDDKGNRGLCLALCSFQMAAAMAGKKPTLDDINHYVDEAIRIGAIASKDGVNSADGWVADPGHGKLAEIAGLPGHKKIYERYTIGRLTALLQWGIPVELRDEGKHSLLAVGWYKEENSDLFYAEVLDPWPATNDKRFDMQRAMTQRAVNNKWVDSRTIEYLGWYEKA